MAVSASLGQAFRWGGGVVSVSCDFDRFQLQNQALQSTKIHANHGTGAGLTIDVPDRRTRHDVTSYANYYAPLLAVGFYF